MKDKSITSMSTSTSKKLIALSVLCGLCVSLVLPGCTTMTPEQQAQWSATGNAVAQQASGILLDEAAARLRESRNKQSLTKDAKDAK